MVDEDGAAVARTKDLKKTFFEASFNLNPNYETVPLQTVIPLTISLTLHF